MILVDSSVWIDLFNGFESLQALKLESLIRKQTICVSGLIVQEVLQGFRYANQRQETALLLREYTLIQPTLYTHEQAANIYCHCRSKGLTIRKSMDLVIAALAIEHDIPLLQKDRDFEAISQHFPLNLVQL